MSENDNKKKIILTGATGTIGQAVIRRCMDLGWEVCAIVNPDSRRKDNITTEENVHKIECHLSQIQKICEEDVCKGADYFLHLGWCGTIGIERYDEDLQNRNVLYALEACRVAHQMGCEVFLFAGSQAEYGRIEGKLSANTPTKPENAYGVAKLKAGMETKKLCRQYGMRHLYFRILSVYGPNDTEKSMVMSSVLKLRQGVSPQFTKGEQLWDYLYCDDAACALLLACNKAKESRVYCLGSGIAKPLKEYINIIGKVVNPEISLGIGELPYAGNQVMQLCADITDLKKDFDFEPKIDFETGIYRILESL